MTLAEQIATYLQTAGVGTLATNLFYSALPDTDSGDFCVGVFDTGGPQPDKYLPTKVPTFQVFVRSTTYDTGREKLDDVRAALHQLQNQTLVTGQTYFYYILAQSEGGHIGVNPDNGKNEFSINFICKTR